MNKITIYILILPLLMACGGEEDRSETADVDLQESLDQLTAEMDDPVWEFKSHNDEFEIEIPAQMQERSDLNPTAQLQFSYTERFFDETMENYIIVLSDAYEEDKIPVDNSGLFGYADRSLDSLMKGKESFEILNEPVIDTINSMSAVMHQVKASMALSDTNKIDVYYHTGVYQGAKAHYQIVSWTLFDQKEDFEKDMERMVYSFKEK
jgi:hypothetical protein